MDFIFMLTRQDRTVVDCLEVLEAIKPLGLTHIGFKDLGVDRETLRALNRAIRDQGAVSYLEVVSAAPEAVLNAARVARALGVERLMGGTEVAEVLRVLAGSRTEYYPFPGRPLGHPTRLGGQPEEVEAQCRQFLEMGCAGVDLLAYRATEADPLELTRACRRGLGAAGRLIVAGSIDSAERIRGLAAAGAEAFTIGSAAFDGSFSPRSGLLIHQLQDVLAAARAAKAPQVALELAAGAAQSWRDEAEAR